MPTCSSESFVATSDVDDVDSRVISCAPTQYVMHWNNVGNKAVTDRRLCPPPLPTGGYFKHTSFSCRYICRAIMCKHDVIHIQHAHCGLIGPDRGARKVGPWVWVISPQRVFLRAVYSQVQGCMWAVLPSAGRPHWAAFWVMCKYDIIQVHNISQCARGGPSHGHR